MDEQEKNLRSPQDEEFSLEDILKEFGTSAPAPAPEEPDVQIWDGKTPPAPRPASTLPSDTVRLDEVTKAVRQLTGEPEEPQSVPDATVRFDALGGDTPEEPPRIPVHEETVEPYSEQWEPEYEQPIGDYVPPEPIVFRPKSRLHELKRKLVEGPERRYYELAEQGLGKLQTAVFLNLLISLLAAGSTAMYALGMVQTGRLRLMVFVQFLALMLSALLGSYQLMEGFSDLIHRRFTLNTLLQLRRLLCRCHSLSGAGADSLLRRLQPEYDHVPVERLPEAPHRDGSDGHHAQGHPAGQSGWLPRLLRGPSRLPPE